LDMPVVAAATTGMSKFILGCIQEVSGALAM